MKDEILKELRDVSPYKLTPEIEPYVREAMDIYAVSVAKQALEDAANNAEVDKSSCPPYYLNSVNKQSILDTEIKTP